jgi:hypothetical protein
MKARAARAKAPSLAAAKHLRTLFESAAVRQKAHDARLDLQRRLRDHNTAIQQRMETHRIRDMARGDTPLTARVGKGMLGGFDVGSRPRSRTPTRRIRAPRTPPKAAPRAPPPSPPAPPSAPSAPPPRKGPERYDLSPPRPSAKKPQRTSKVARPSGLNMNQPKRMSKAKGPRNRDAAMRM